MKHGRYGKGGWDHKREQLGRIEARELQQPDECVAEEVTLTWIEELERLEKAATPGSWATQRNEHACAYFGRSDVFEVGSASQRVGVALVPGSEPNARLIAALRNNASRLLAIAREVEELREENAMLQKIRSAARAVVTEQQKDGSGHPGDVEDLRNCLDGYEYEMAARAPATAKEGKC
jgi:hypothetical protein